VFLKFVLGLKEELLRKKIKKSQKKYILGF